MKAKILFGATIALVASVLTSCGGTGGFGKLEMDSADAVTKVKELVSDNFDSNEWKLVEMNWNEGSGDRATLENNLNLGYVSVKVVNAKGQVFVQSFIGQTGFTPSNISPDHWYSYLDYEKIKPIDMTKFDPAAIVKILDEAKAMIPEEYEFKSLADYEIKAGVPDNREGEGEYTAEQTASFTINVVEKGNETVSNAGTTSIIYYEIDYKVAADGTITMDLD